ncbi:MAG: hypothetical protein EOM87_10455, partial [Clostridia bacterium]|nr:hypothetical protein [Clostridia bacterium]
MVETVKRLICIVTAFICISAVLCFAACDDTTVVKNINISISIRRIENMETAFLSLNPQGVESEFRPSQELFDFSQLV